MIDFNFLKNILQSLLLVLICSCFHDSEEYSFNMYYKYHDTNFNTIDEHSDIPLAVGLTIINSDNKINFSSKNGNIISISYICEKDLVQIKNFYTSTIPQLGWRLSNHEHHDDFIVVAFVRENETLEIEFVDDGLEKIVNFHAQLKA